MDVKATLLTKTSSKTGKPYKVIEIQLTDSYVKQVFLEKAEEEILKLVKQDDMPQDWR